MPSDIRDLEELKKEKSKLSTQRDHSKEKSSGTELSFLRDEKKDILMVEIEPSRCKPWKYHNRDMAWLTIERCRDLMISIQNTGQNMPVLVRKINGDPNHDFELIYGVRRWFSCSVIPNRKLLAHITEADDKTCMVLMHAENAFSKDISEFERAFSFSQQMKSGVFKNQTEMAKAMGVSQGLISRMIKGAELFDYDWIRILFSSKLEIKVKPAYTLVSMLKDPSKEKFIKIKAQDLENKIHKGEKIPSEKILKELIAAGNPVPNSLEKNGIILPLGQNQAIYCKRNAVGKVMLVFDNTARDRKREELMAAVEKAIDEFVLF